MEVSVRFFVLLAVACGGARTPEPVAPETPEAPEAPDAPAPEEADDDLAGAYAEADPASPAIIEARERIQALLRERTGDDTLTISAVTSAKKQVVAGMNYELVVDLTGAGGDKSGVTVVAYENLQREWSLTSVEGL